MTKHVILTRNFVIYYHYVLILSKYEKNDVTVEFKIVLEVNHSSLIILIAMERN